MTDGSRAHEGTPLRHKSRLGERIDRKIHDEGFLPDRITRRGFLKTAGAVGGTLLAGWVGIMALRNGGKNQEVSQTTAAITPITEGDDTFTVLLSPEIIEQGQATGHFNEIAIYDDYPPLSIDENGNGRVTPGEFQVITVAMHPDEDGKIILRRGTEQNPEGELVLTEGHPLFDKVNGKEFAVVRRFGPEYDHDKWGHLHLGPNENGGAWYEMINGERTNNGNIHYKHLDPTVNKFLKPNDLPYGFSATFADRVYREKPASATDNLGSHLTPQPNK